MATNYVGFTTGNDGTIASYVYGVTGNIYLVGSSALTVTGNVAFAGAITGNVAIANAITGNVTIVNVTSVTGNITLVGTSTVTGSVILIGTSAITGNVTISGASTITGNVAIVGSITGNVAASVTGSVAIANSITGNVHIVDNSYPTFSSKASYTASASGNITTPTTGKRLNVTDIIISASNSGAVYIYDAVDTTTSCLTATLTLATNGGAVINFTKPYITSATGNILKWIAGAGATGSVFVHYYETT